MTGRTTQLTQTILWVLALALLLRGSVLLLHQPWDPDAFRSRNLQGDAVEYFQISTNLSEGHGFSSDAMDPYRPNSLRTPLYPSFIATIFRVTGPNFFWPAVLQIILSLLTIAYLMQWAGRELGAGTATLAGLILATDIDYAHLNVTLWSETLFVAFLVPMLHSWSSLMKAGTVRRAMTAGILLGFATLVRPITLYLVVILAATSGMAAWLTGEGAPTRRIGRRTIWAAGVTLIVVATFSVVISPWVWRNTQTFGTARLTSSGGWNLLNVHAARVVAAREGIDEIEARRRLESRVDELCDPIIAANPMRRSQVQLRVAVQTLAEDVPASISMQLAGMTNLLISPGRSRWMQSMGVEAVPRPVVQDVLEKGWLTGFRDAIRGTTWITVLAALRVLWLLLLYALAAIGLYRLIRTKRFDWAVPLALTALYLFVLTGPLGDSRFRVALLPTIAIFASMGVVELRARLAPGKPPVRGHHIL